MHDFFAAVSSNNILNSVPVPISVLVVDDHDALRGSIMTAFEDEREINIIGEAKNGIEALERVDLLAPDVVVMDVSMPLMDGIAATQRITNRIQPPKVLIISHHDEEEYIRDCMKAGASGYIMKDTLIAELAQAIHVVHNGGHFFSPRIAKRIVGFYLKQVSPLDTE